jgi:hypothetical protein
MVRICRQLFSKQIQRLFVFSFAIAFALLMPAAARAQRSKGALDPPDETQPTLNQFKGVRIGMMADDARKKLGTPRDKSAEQDFYMVNDNEVLQVYYDKGGAVSAISIDFMSGASAVPTSKEVFGADAEAKADGSIYKLVRYPKAGYWVSYSRTAGNEATTTVTMQKIQ